MAQSTLREALEDRVPPHSIEAEMSALGSILLSERAAEELQSILVEDDFYRPAHREIFRAMRQLLQSNKAIDLVMLKNELAARGKLEEIGDVDYLIQIAESVPSASNGKYYAGVVQDKATLRRLETAGQEIVGVVRNPEMDVDEKVDAAEAAVFEVGRKRLGKDFQPVKALAKEFFVDVDRLLETGEPVLGTPSGYADLDAVTTGFYGGDLVIVAARPGMGKTSLVLNFALNMAAKAMQNVAVFSLEMSGKQLVRRMIATLAKVPMDTLKKANLSTSDYQKLADACEDLYSLPIFIDDSSDVSPMEVRGKCRRLKADGGLALVVVDYLQLMRGSKRTENRVQEISEIARGLKSMAKDLDVPVIALSQLNRGVESRPDKRPMLSDIRESGSIEAEADMVMFIYREKYYERKQGQFEADRDDPSTAEPTELSIAKHRNGPTGTVLLGFQPVYTRFTLLDQASKDDYWRLMKERYKKGGEE